MPSADRCLEPRRKPRQVRAELTRERILTAAAHVFAERGYAGGTTNRIAERARVSIPCSLRRTRDGDGNWR